ncbi:hypothetical protein DFA_01096 [Cavenderia fasciculata]|uniref:Paramecium surface antigen repeat-containing protein n=1 Tax=Cavenderia fasciculata TaxID=261658 RepID=F4PQV6_CACFS|nr:uncharacterized protein DFA_01096 [Cavenderia fasciculata]EGG21221.1 hypothetical protein DFA_01096 [Cavenderia fasciculata]|eukprot:XP_004359071.1 hypothetical protein DFA_01096 [Cavenderia fasciculata]
MNSLFLNVILTIVLLQISFSTIGVSGLNQCNPVFQETCVRNGQSCGIINGTDYHCVDDSTCNSYNKCQDKRPSGGTCFENIDCKAWMLCIGGTCLEANYGQVGDNCTQDWQCLTNLLCVSRTCINTQSTCANSAQCSYDTYCAEGGICQDRSLNGQSCETDSTCLEHSRCYNGKCIDVYSIGVGGSCNSSDVCDVSIGLSCQSGSCAYVNLTTPLSPATLDCTTTNCISPDYEKCVCTGNQTSGTCYPSIPTTKTQILSCGVAQKTFYQCLVDHKCLYSYTAKTPSSCSLYHCGEEYCTQGSLCEWSFDSNRRGTGCGGDTALNFNQQTCKFLGYEINPYYEESQTSISSHLIIPTMIISTIIFSIIF